MNSIRRSFLLVAMIQFVLVTGLEGASKTWVLGGYLPEAPTQKVWLTITGNKIEKKSAQKPSGSTLILDTESLIFPGLIDMHNHIKYNALPLWNNAKGQFLNRFEWRTQKKTLTGYDSVSFNMKPVNEVVCAAVRWAELKALSGGVTSLQGIGQTKDHKCGRGFGPHNIEIPGEYGNSKKVRAMVDIIGPDFLKKIYEPLIKPQMDKGATADQAFAKLGKEAEGNPDHPLFGYGMETVFNGRNSVLRDLKEKKVLSVVAHLAEGMRTDAYNKTEFGYLKSFGIVLEGMVLIHAVSLNKVELNEAAKKGVSLVWSPFSNLLLYGAEFSGDKMVYGHTLDVAEAKRQGVNVALGSDWTPTGSKHLLDELKIAKRYLKAINDSSISDKDLVEMATANGAKALGLGTVIGKVEQGFMADLMLVKKVSGNPYSALVNATQKEVSLVIVGGEPLYGDTKLIETTTTAWKEAQAEVVPLNQTRCDYKKLLRVSAGGGDPTLSKLSSAKSISDELTGKMSAYAATVKKTGSQKKIGYLAELDPLFSCEENDDSEYKKRFSNFIEMELKQNAKNRKDLRHSLELDDEFNPMESNVGGADID